MNKRKSTGCCSVATKQKLKCFLTLLAFSIGCVGCCVVVVETNEYLFVSKAVTSCCLPRHSRSAASSKPQCGLGVAACALVVELAGSSPTRHLGCRFLCFAYPSDPALHGFQGRNRLGGFFQLSAYRRTLIQLFCHKISRYWRSLLTVAVMEESRKRKSEDAEPTQEDDAQLPQQPARKGKKAKQCSEKMVQKPSASEKQSTSAKQKVGLEKSGVPERKAKGDQQSVRIASTSARKAKQEMKSAGAETKQESEAPTRKKAVKQSKVPSMDPSEKPSVSKKAASKLSKNEALDPDVKQKAQTSKKPSTSKHKAVHPKASTGSSAKAKKAEKKPMPKKADMTLGKAGLKSTKLADKGLALEKVEAKKPSARPKLQVRHRSPSPRAKWFASHPPKPRSKLDVMTSHPSSSRSSLAKSNVWKWFQPRVAEKKSRTRISWCSDCSSAAASECSKKGHALVEPRAERQMLVTSLRDCLAAQRAMERTLRRLEALQRRDAVRLTATVDVNGNCEPICVALTAEALTAEERIALKDFLEDLELLCDDVHPFLSASAHANLPSSLSAKLPERVEGLTLRAGAILLGGRPDRLDVRLDRTPPPFSTLAARKHAPAFCPEDSDDEGGEEVEEEETSDEDGEEEEDSDEEEETEEETDSEEETGDENETESDLVRIYYDQAVLPHQARGVKVLGYVTHNLSHVASARLQGSHDSSWVRGFRHSTVLRLSEVNFVGDE